MTDEIHVALYLRLSMEDEAIEDESNSITNQRTMLQQQVNQIFDKQQFSMLEFVDDGYSGTNFDRPAIRELLEQARNGRIQCIVVKDFSRFSRDYIETGSYLEQIFPFLGIRFISVNDHYDSQNYQGNLAGIDTSFKYLVNDLYSKDISVKVKSSLQAKREKGVFANGSTTFGYRKDPLDCHHLLVEEKEADIIRRIFQMTADGKSSTFIAKKFNEEKVKTPIEYKMERGVTTMKPKGDEFIWNSSTICQILRNEMYVGNLVYDKYETPTVGGKAHLKPRSEWKTYPNHHEPIVQREIFESIQKTRGRYSQRKRKVSHPLIGKVCCAHCGRTLKIEPVLNPYFTCPTRYQKHAPECAYHVNVMFVEQIILYALQREIDRQLDIESMQKKRIVVLQEKVSEISKTHRTKKDKMKNLQGEKRQKYEEYRKNRITQDDYLHMQAELQLQEQRLIEEAEEIEEKLQKVKHELQDCIQDQNVVKEKCSITELNKKVIDTFISKIVIKDEKHIEIVWNFRDSSICN